MHKKIQIKTSITIDYVRKNVFEKKDLRPTVVDDSSNIRFINAHSKRYCCNNNLKMIKHKHSMWNLNFWIQHIKL